MPAPSRTPRRYTGPTRAVKDATHDRDGHLCVICGQPGTEWDRLVWHHRKNRGMGGSTDPAINRTSNGLTIHATENRALEVATRDEFYAHGWKIHDIRDALTTAVLYPDGTRWLLDDDGGRTLT